MGELRIPDTVPAAIPTAPLVSADTAPVAIDRRRGDRLANWFLRTGLAFVFLYAAMSSFFHPETFAGYFPAFLPQSWATELLPVFAVYEVGLAALLCTRRFFRPAAVLAALTLAAITASNPDSFDVLFRNVAISCAALALAAQSSPELPARRLPFSVGHTHTPSDPAADRSDGHQLEHPHQTPDHGGQP